MSLQNLSKDILLKADLEKANLTKQLEEEESNLELEQQQSFEKYKETLTSKYNREYSSLKTNILGKYNKEAKSVVLDAKTKLIEESYTNSLIEINSLNKSDKEKVLANLLKIAKDVLIYETIICSKNDSTFIKSKVDKKIKVLIDENLNGLKFEANGGKELLDLSFEKLFQDLFEESQEEIQKILFK